MKRELIFKKIEEIFEDIFEISDIEINNQTKRDEISDWDSLGHIRLINAIEDEFNISIELEDAIELESCNQIIDCIDKLKNKEES